MPPKKSSNSTNGANIGYEAELWKMADALRGNMDAAEYKHVILEARLRDALLPKLISGEIRVEDAERFVGRAV